MHGTKNTFGERLCWTSLRDSNECERVVGEKLVSVCEMMVLVFVWFSYASHWVF